MKVLYTVPSYPTGKHHGFIDEIECLINKGYEVAIAPIWESKPELKVDRLPVKIIYKPHILTLKTLYLQLCIFILHPFISLKFIKHARKYLGFIETIRSLVLVKTILSYKPQHIHSYFANNAALKVLLISQCLNIRFTCSGRGTDVLLKRIKNFKYLVNNSQPFITISNYNKAVIENLHGIKGNNIVVIHHGINIKRYSRKKWQEISIAKIISVTWLRKVKGVEFLINACSILANKQINFQCYIIGDGYLREAIEDQISKLKLDKQIVLLGEKKHNEVLDWLLNSDIFVLPSLSEGIAISAMEAMATGLPVIATRITGMPELIDHGINGILVPPEDSESLAIAIENFIKNPELAIQIGNQARKKIEEHFNIEKTVARLENIFRGF